MKQMLIPVGAYECLLAHGVDPQEYVLGLVEEEIRVLGL